MSKRSYIIQKYGKGFCRNGHSRAEWGQYPDGKCKRCRQLVGANQHLKRKHRKRMEGNNVDVHLGW